MSSGKSDGIHSGPYGAAVMTSLSWFSGNSDPSRKFMAGSLKGWSRKSSGRRRSERDVADDARALHLAMAGRVVHDGVVLGRAVVPHRHAVRLPAEAHLELGDVGLADEVVQELARAGVGVLAEADVFRRVEVGEVRRERVDEEDL